nr:MAG TPA: hypothetical protein [Caudoviricetes sp.]
MCYINRSLHLLRREECYSVSSYFLPSISTALLLGCD